MSADLPGVSPKNVDVTLDNGTLTIKGEKTTDVDVVEDGYRRRERSSGAFFRQFTLPESTNDAKVKAKSVNGVLTITIPKTEKPKPLSVTVEVV